MTESPLKIGVIAGEVSGDLLGGDLIAALRAMYAGPVTLVGVVAKRWSGKVSNPCSISPNSPSWAFRRC